MTPFLKDGNLRVRTVFSKAYIILLFLIKKLTIFKCGFSTNVISAFLIQENIFELSELTLLKGQ